MEDKKYERLTERGYHYDAIPLSLRHIRRLQELENAIEDKILVELPAPIGSPIYILVFDKEDPCAWCDKDHSGFGDVICEDYDSEYPQVEEWLSGEKICPQFELEIRPSEMTWSKMSELKWFNVTWFTDKNAAAAALEKYKEKWNEERNK